MIALGLDDARQTEPGGFLVGGSEGATLRGRPSLLDVASLEAGRHVGNGFPRMAGLRVTGTDVAWPQVHALRVDRLVVEHWAVRDGYGMLESISNQTP